MKKISFVGRLLSENKGIDKIIRFVKNNTHLEYILLCGGDTKGHKPGEALITLKENGIDLQKRIIGSDCPYPILKSSLSDVENFRKQIEIINHIGLKNIEKIEKIVTNINN